MTFSIGFRAPALAHLLERMVDHVLEENGSQQLMTDAGRVAVAHPGALTDTDLEQLRLQLLSLLDNRGALRDALAPFLSEPKYDDYEPEGQEATPDEIRDALLDGALLRRDPASRCLYTEQNGQPASLYVNGQVIDFPSRLAPLVQRLADQRCLSGQELSPWQDDADALQWIQTQVAAGHWFVELADDDPH
jgi:50S ribosomal protein L16 3-hydroxylase